MNAQGQEFKLSGEKFKSIFDAFPYASYIWKQVQDDLILIEYNQEAVQVTDGKVKDLIGIKTSEFYKDRPKILEDFNECVTKKTKVYRETIYKYSTTGKVKNLIRFYDFIEPDLVFVHTEDITKQKKAEESLKKEEQEKSLILQAVSDHIIYYDLNQDIIWANRAASDSLNVPNKEITGRKCYELWHNKKVPCDGCPVLRAKESGITQSNEMETPDGRKWMVMGFPVKNEKKEIIGMVEITRDITERKHIEKALRNSEQFLQNIFNAIQDGVSILDLQLNIIKVNQWMEEKYAANYPLVGKKCYEAYQNRKSICPWCPSKKTIESGIVHSEIVPYPSMENPTGWIDLSAFPLKDQEGNVINIIEYVKDITKQKIAESELKESEEKYRRAYNRIYLYKDLFTHDINNIFQNILSSNELAMLYSNNPEKLQDYVEVANLIKEQISRGAKLVSNVQKLSELEEFKKPMYSLEVCSVLKNVIESTKKNFLHKKIDIKFTSPEKKYLVKANELLLDVFENIIINAVKHNVNQIIELQINLSKLWIDKQNFIEIEFIDNGIGIPDSMKDVIFQRDYRIEKASGIGLGLLLIKRILESYDGSVRVENKIAGDYSKGSNFIVLIPEG